MSGDQLEERTKVYLIPRGYNSIATYLASHEPLYKQLVFNHLQ